MTDSVRCARDPNGTFTCDVHIDSDFTTPEPASPAAPAVAPGLEPPIADAGGSSVAVLVGKFNMPRASVPVLTQAATVACASSEMSVALAFAAGAPLLVGLLGAKGAFDVGQCFAEQANQASDAATQPVIDAACAERGGRITRIESDTETCTLQGAR